MEGGDIGDKFLFIPHPSRELMPTWLKRLRYLEADTTYELQQQAALKDPNIIASVEECRPSSQPRGGIRIVEGGESHPSRGVSSSAKGKRKDMASLGVPPPVERPTSPPPFCQIYRYSRSRS